MLTSTALGSSLDDLGRVLSQTEERGCSSVLEGPCAVDGPVCCGGARLCYLAPLHDEAFPSVLDRKLPVE